MLFDIVPEDFPFQNLYQQGRSRCFHGHQDSDNAEHLREFLHALALGVAGSGTERPRCCGERSCRTDNRPVSGRCQCGTPQSCQMSQKMKKRAGQSPASVKPTKDEKEMTDKVQQINLGSLDFRGSAPKQITVKVTSEALVVTGRHSDTLNSVEITKKLLFPPDVDGSRLGCRYTDGQVIVELPIPEKEVPEGKADSKEKSCPSEKQKTENGDGDKSDERAERHDCKDIPETDDSEDQELTKIKECLDERVDNLAGLFSLIFGAPPFDSKQDENSKSEESQDKEKEEHTKKGDETKKFTPDIVSEMKEAPGQKDEVANCHTATVSVDVGDGAATGMDLFDDNPELQVENDDFVHVEKQTTLDAKSEQTILSDTTEDAEVERFMSEATQEERKEDLQELRESFAEGSDVVVTDVSNETADFKVKIDLSNYNPEDVRVVFKDGYIFVEAEREIKGDNYCQTENLSRRIRVPETVDESKVTSVLSSTGIMTIQTTSIKGEMDEEEACHMELME